MNLLRTGNEKTGNQSLHLPVAAGMLMKECTMAALNEAGYAVPASKTEHLKVAGCIQTYTDNRLGKDGDMVVLVKRGAFVFDNDGSIQQTDLLKSCYIKDEITVTLLSEGSSVAGKILAVEENSVTVEFQ